MNQPASDLNHENLVLTVEEAAKFLRISRSSAYAAVRSGEIPTIRVGRRLLVPRGRLEQLLNGDGPDERTRAGREDARSRSHEEGY